MIEKDQQYTTTLVQSEYIEREIVGIFVGRLVVGFDVGLILIVGASVVSAEVVVS